MRICRFLIVLGSIVLGQGIFNASAQVPELLAVPEHISSHARDQLSRLRAGLLARLSSLQTSASRFRTSDCAAGVEKNSSAATECRAKADWLKSQQSLYIRDSNSFNNAVRAAAAEASCKKHLSDQLARDKKALQTEQKTIGVGLDELDNWTKASEDAQKDALKTASKLLLAGLGEKLIAQENSLRSFKGWLTRYKKQLQSDNIPFDLIETKIERAAKGYTTASIYVTGGRAIEGLNTFNETLTLATNEISSIAAQMSRSDDAVRELLADKRITALINSDSAGRDLANSLVTMAAHTGDLEGLAGKLAGPSADLANFLIDYGYDAKEWWESRKRILQQYLISDTQLKAIDALKAQTECTIKRLKECETGPVMSACDHKGR